jgi:hypothetical protein
MAVKRIPDPAGLLMDRVSVTDLDKALPGTVEWDAMAEVLLATSVPGRIDSLRRHVDLEPLAKALLERFESSGQRADAQLLLEVTQAESRALYLDAAPYVIRDKKRQDGTRKERRPDITEWIDRQLDLTPGAKSPELWAKAPEWITEQIGPRRFALRVTMRRHARK